MKKPAALLFPLCGLLISACVTNPAQRDALRPALETAPRPQETQAAPTLKAEPKTIVPDINEQGRRGDMARMMLKKSSLRFLDADTDKDYRISMEEAQKHLPHMGRSFSRYDRNGDGGIDWHEYLGHDEWPRPVHQ